MIAKGKKIEKLNIDTTKIGIIKNNGSIKKNSSESFDQAYKRNYKNNLLKNYKFYLQLDFATFPYLAVVLHIVFIDSSHP